MRVLRQHSALAVLSRPGLPCPALPCPALPRPPLPCSRGGLAHRTGKSRVGPPYKGIFLGPQDLFFLSFLSYKRAPQRTPNPGPSGATQSVTALPCPALPCPAHRTSEREPYLRRQLVRLRGMAGVPCTVAFDAIGTAVHCLACDNGTRLWRGE